MQLAKVFLLAITFAFISLSGICHAAEPDPNLWFPAGTGKDFRHYFSVPDLTAAKNTYDTGNDTTIFLAQTLYFFDDGGTAKFQGEYDIDPNNKRIRMIEGAVYNPEGNKVNSRKYELQWASTAPGTPEDKRLIFITDWITSPHTKKLDLSQWLPSGEGKNDQHYLYIPNLNAAKNIYQKNNNATIFRIWLLFISENGESMRVRSDYDISANKKRYRVTQIIAYDKEGNITASAPYPDPQWENIVLGSPGMTNHATITDWITRP